MVDISIVNRAYKPISICLSKNGGDPAMANATSKPATAIEHIWVWCV